MTKPKLNPCKALVIIDGDVECYCDVTKPASKIKCLKTRFYSAGKPGVPNVRCLFLGEL